MSAFKNMSWQIFVSPVDISMHLLNNKDVQLPISISLLHFITVYTMSIYSYTINK